MDVSCYTQVSWEIVKVGHKVQFSTSILCLIAHCCEQIQLFKLLKGADYMRLASTRDSHSNTFLHLLCFFNNFEVFETIYKNVYEKLDLTELQNSKGQSVLDYIKNCNNPDFKTLLNKYRRTTNETEFIKTKAEFTEIVNSTVVFEDGYPVRIEDSYFLLTFVSTHFNEFEFDEVVAQRYEFSYAHMIFLLGDLKLIQMLLSSLKHYNKYKVFLLRDFKKNSILHLAARYEYSNILQYCFDYYFEFIVFSTNAMHLKIWDMFQNSSKCRSLLSYKNQVVTKEPLVDLEKLLKAGHDLEGVLLEFCRVCGRLYDEQDDPIVVKLDLDLHQYITREFSTDYLDCVVQADLNIRVYHLLFLTNDPELIRVCLQNAVRNEIMNIFTKKDHKGNTVLHYLALFNNFTLVRELYTKYHEYIFRNSLNAKKMAVRDIVKTKNPETYNAIEKLYGNSEVNPPKTMDSDFPRMPDYQYEDDYIKQQAEKLKNFEEVDTKQSVIGPEISTPNRNGASSVSTLEAKVKPHEKEDNFPKMPDYDYGNTGIEIYQEKVKDVREDQFQTVKPNSKNEKYYEENRPNFNEREVIKETPEEYKDNTESEQGKQYYENEPDYFEPPRDADEDSYIKNMKLDEYMATKPSKHDRIEQEQAEEKGTSLNDCLNFMIEYANTHDLYNPALKLGRIKDKHVLESINECLDHIQFDSKLNEYNVLFIHMVILTQKDDIIFYAFKKWEMKDAKKYNIFELKDAGGYDVMSLCIMTQNESIISHLLTNYQVYLNKNTENTNSWMNLAKQLSNGHIYHILVDNLLQKSSKSKNRFNKEEDELATGNGLRMSRSFHEGFPNNAPVYSNNPMMNPMSNMHTIYPGATMYNTQHMSGNRYYEGSDSDEDMSEYYMHRLNRYQTKIEKLTWKYQRNLQKLNVYSQRVRTLPNSGGERKTQANFNMTNLNGMNMNGTNNQQDLGRSFYNNRKPQQQDLNESDINRRTRYNNATRLPTIPNKSKK